MGTESTHFGDLFAPKSVVGAGLELGAILDHPRMQFLRDVSGETLKMAIRVAIRVIRRAIQMGLVPQTPRPSADGTKRTLD